MLAISFETIIGALTVFYSFLSVLFFVPVIAALYTRRAGAPEAFAAVGLGIPVLIVVDVMTAGQGFGVWNPTLIGLLVSGVAFISVFAVRRKSHDVSIG